MVKILFRNFSIYLALCQVALTLADDNDAPKKAETTSRLQVHVPQSLRKDDGYEHREALFGIPPYGGSIAQNVYYADSKLCHESADESHSGWPEREMDEDGVMKAWEPPFILMVDRGGCSFVQKVRNAQKAGAAGVIIADNQCLCTDSACIKKDRENKVQSLCQSAEPIMADDGSGGDISIPSFLMFKMDAQKIIDEVKNNQIVQVEMAWSLPTPDDRVEYDLWTIPSNPVSKDFIKSFQSLAEALDDHAYFTPHMYIYDGIKSHCQGNSGENMCYNLCTNNGRYCATDPDNDLENGISGADVVTESLRRICIWKHYGEKDGIGREWWSYHQTFLERCDNADYFMNQECVDDALNHAKIDKDAIETCMKDSGGLKGDVVNSLLDKELASQTRRGVVVIPTAFVNTVPLRGALSGTSIFNAICAGFLEGTQPDTCVQCAGCPDLNKCVKEKSCDSGIYKVASEHAAKNSVSKKVFAMSLLSVCVIFGAAGYLHWKKTREDMRNQVRGILAEYMPLEGGEEGETGNPMDFANKKGGMTSLIS